MAYQGHAPQILFRQLPLTLAAIAVMFTIPLLGQEDSKLIPAGVQPESGKVIPDEAETPPDYRIGVDDTIGIRVLHVDEMNGDWRVGVSGDVRFPMIGRIPVAGMTVQHLQEELTEKLSEYVRKPEVAVFVTEYRSHPVTVAGDVATPGVIQIKGPTPLFKVLVEAGGVKDTATTVSLTRLKENGEIPHPNTKASRDGLNSVLELPVDAVERGYGPDATVEVKVHDIVTVGGVAKKNAIYVTGGVNRPGALPIEDNETVTLSEAIALSGGLGSSSVPKKTLIRHLSDSGEETALSKVDLKAILDGDTADLALRDGDVVVIPTKKAGPSIYLQAAIMAGITAGIYVLLQ